MQVRKFREQIERDRQASRESGKPPPPDDAETEMDATQGRATLEPTGAPGDMPAIHFGCSLTSRGVQLRTGVSALFAVAPGGATATDRRSAILRALPTRTAAISIASLVQD